MNDQTQPIPAASNPEPTPSAPATRENKPKRWRGRVPLAATAAAGLAVGALVTGAVFAATGPDVSPGVSTVASSSDLGQRTDGGGGTDASEVPAAPAAPDSGDGSTVPAVPTPPAPGDGATPPAPPAGGPGKGGPADGGPGKGGPGAGGPGGAVCAPGDGATPPAPPAEGDGATPPAPPAPPAAPSGS
ncbi:hypothetical protein [Rhodococcus sp. Leaf278]|uniref:hypothetical protein n=1 Tax=Rhodococcus sp. Leaf278 TaxID=1736319 RepID=UPI0012E399B1|nr:hypothetical protein [Rhodococcus sp. Leaf278]